MKIDVNTYIDVSPVDVLNPSQFCCHVVQNAVEFKQLTKEINEFYDSSVADIQIKWEKLVPCVALYDGKYTFFKVNSFSKLAYQQIDMPKHLQQIDVVTINHKVLNILV